jgi:uncharacterized lipoprotein YmbA
MTKLMEWRMALERHTRKPRFSLLLALLAAGCASDPQQHLYVLAPAAHSLSDNAPGGTRPEVQLQPVLVPDYLDTTDILIRTGPNEVKASATAQWAERLSEGIAHALRADLAARLPDSRIELSPPTDGAARQIRVTVDSLDMWPDGHCVLVAHWIDGKQAGQGHFSAAAAAPVSDARRVSDLAGLVDQLAGRL